MSVKVEPVIFEYGLILVWQERTIIFPSGCQHHCVGVQVCAVTEFHTVGREFFNG